MSAELRTTLSEVEADAAGCVRCALRAGRTQVVFGAGDPDADLALVGEAPGFHEDRTGMPFAGRAGDLLARLLGGIGLALDDVYLATVLKCRPPGNRDPLPEETAACEPYLYRQLELVQPRVVATLGSFAHMRRTRASCAPRPFRPPLLVSRAAIRPAWNLAMRSISFSGTGSSSGRRSVPLLRSYGASSFPNAATRASVAG